MKRSLILTFVIGISTPFAVSAAGDSATVPVPQTYGGSSAGSDAGSVGSGMSGTRETPDGSVGTGGVSSSENINLPSGNSASESNTGVGRSTGGVSGSGAVTDGSRMSSNDQIRSRSGYSEPYTHNTDASIRDRSLSDGGSPGGFVSRTFQ